jgi:phosphoglycolate phosphatase-like HAD superfamily hydrolase
MRLVLFDIDGTLVSDHGASRGAFGEALAAVYGYDRDLTVYDFSGRTDPQIAFMVLRDADVPDETIAERMPRLWETYLAALARNATPGRVRALAGIPELVATLAEHEDVTLALLTGNIEPGARLKLAGPALNDYFAFGAFGSDSAKREELPPIAVQRVAERHGHAISGQDIVIIGDSIYDVRCGVPYGATTIAVASGKTPADRLLAENPTHFFESCADRDKLLQAILG